MPGHSGWRLGVGLTTTLRENIIVTKPRRGGQDPHRVVGPVQLVALRGRGYSALRCTLPLGNTPLH
jgi:hypothetical protein